MFIHQVNFFIIRQRVAVVYLYSYQKMLLFPISSGPPSKWGKVEISQDPRYDFRTLIHTRNSDPNPVPNHPSRLHLRPKTPACQSNFLNTRKSQWKISLWVTMKMHSFEHESVCICVNVSLYLYLFQSPSDCISFFNLFCRQGDTCTQGITPMWNRIYLRYCVRNSNRISGYFA